MELRHPLLEELSLDFADVNKMKEMKRISFSSQRILNLTGLPRLRKLNILYFDEQTLYLSGHSLERMFVGVFGGAIKIANNAFNIKELEIDDIRKPPRSLRFISSCVEHLRLREIKNTRIIEKLEDPLRLLSL